MIESRSLESLPRTCRGGEHCCRPEKPCPEEGGNDLFPGFPICTPLMKVHFIDHSMEKSSTFVSSMEGTVKMTKIAKAS